MNANDEQLVERLQSTARCRPDLQQLAEEWSELSSDRFAQLATLLCLRQEGVALGILLNLAVINEVRLDLPVWVATLKVVDNITDFLYPCRFQTADAIGPLLEMAVAEDISWERQATAAKLAAELTLKFEQPQQPARKVLWKLSKEIYSPDAQVLVRCGLAMLEGDEYFSDPRHWLSENDLLKDLPEERPPVVIGGNYTVRRPVPKLGRNESCHCGSGKKYKKCCYGKDQELLRDASSYPGLTRTQLKAVPSQVVDSAPIKRMRLSELQKLSPPTLNEEQLVVAFQRTLYGERLDLANAFLMEYCQRVGGAEQAVDFVTELFDSALSARDKPLADKLAQLLPNGEVYSTEASRLHHALLDSSETYAELEALCKKALTAQEDSGDHLLLEISYAFDTLLPALSTVFGRAAIVSEPQRTFDNEVLFGSIEKNRIALDLEPWGEPIEDYLDWLSEKSTDQRLAARKDQEIGALKEQLAEAQKKSTQMLKGLRQKERELETLEAELKAAGSSARGREGHSAESAPQQPREPQTLSADSEWGRQRNALKQTIDYLKAEIRSQQADRQALRQELRDTRQQMSGQEQPSSPPVAEVLPDQESGLREAPSRKVLIPEFSDKFRNSAASLPQPVVAKALHAASGFAAGDQAVLRQAAPLEQLPGYFRVRVGIHHRLILRQGAENFLRVEDIISRQQLETWIRKHSP